MFNPGQILGRTRLTAQLLSLGLPTSFAFLAFRQLIVSMTHARTKKPPLCGRRAGCSRSAAGRQCRHQRFPTRPYPCCRPLQGRDTDLSLGPALVKPAHSEDQGIASLIRRVCRLQLSKQYSWIGCPVQTHTKLICRETERATTDLNIRMKSSRRGASDGAE